MSPHRLQMFAEWRAADKQARAAESDLMRITLKASTSSELPSEGERAAAKRLRATADDLFAVAMAEIDAEAERLRR